MDEEFKGTDNTRRISNQGVVLGYSISFYIDVGFDQRRISRSTPSLQRRSGEQYFNICRYRKDGQGRSVNHQHFPEFITVLVRLERPPSRCRYCCSMISPLTMLKLSVQTGLDMVLLSAKFRSWRWSYGEVAGTAKSDLNGWLYTY